MLEGLILSILWMGVFATFGYAIYAIDKYLGELSLAEKVTLAALGYLAGSWWFISVNFDDFAADTYAQLAVNILQCLPAGSLGLTLAVGIGSIFKHHFKRIDFCVLVVLTPVAWSMWVNRFDALTSQGLQNYGHYQLLEERARFNSRNGYDALEIALASHQPFEIREPFADKYRLLSGFKSDDPKLREYARKAVVNGKLNLDEETLFCTGDGRKLDFEQQIARRVVDALAERTRSKFDSEAIRRQHWTNLISEANAYASAKTSRFAADKYIVNLRRAKAIGRQWLAEIDRVRRANQELESDIPALPK